MTFVNTHTHVHPFGLNTKEWIEVRFSVTGQSFPAANESGAAEKTKNLRGHSHRTLTDVLRSSPSTQVDETGSILN